MIDFFSRIQPHHQALIAGVFTWGMTALGAAMVLFFIKTSKKMSAVMLGFAAGVMTAASFWSLLAPSIELAESQGLPGWLPAVVGFLVGGAAVRLGDLLLPHLHPRRGVTEGPDSSWRRTTLLVAAITLHNVPEGMAIGIAFGAAATAQATGSAPEGTMLGAAIALSLGIGVQNFPEGAAVAIPLRGEGLSRVKAFWYGQLSGAVEPISAVVGAVAILAVRPLLPFGLAFAAGAMMFVVFEELVPESQADVRHHDIATLAAMCGFALMMALDVALG